MISREIELNEFTHISLLLETKIGDDPLYFTILHVDQVSGLSCLSDNVIFSPGLNGGIPR